MCGVSNETFDWHVSGRCCVLYAAHDSPRRKCTRIKFIIFDAPGEVAFGEFHFYLHLAFALFLMERRFFLNKIFQVTR